MATLASDPLKERLLSKGLWSDFVRMRHDICESEGLASSKAARAVLEKIDPEAVSLLRGRGRPKKKGKTVDGEASIGVETAAEVSVSDEARNVIAGARSSSEEKVSVGVAGGFEITKDTFAGKSCSNVASILWAYSKHRVKDITPADAPSELAWNFLLDMRQSPSFKADMMGKMAVQWAKQSEKSEGADWEGKSEYDDLEALRIANGGGF